MPPHTGYPIVEERTLRPPRRRLGLFARRDPGELPEAPTGTVLVFAVNGGYKVYPDSGHLRGSEDAVVEARSVSVVYVRSRRVMVDVEIPSGDMGYHFLVRTTFECRVTDPEAVVASGVENATVILDHHLRNDPELMRLGVAWPVEETHRLSSEVSGRIRAYLEFYPARIPGIEVSLANITVLPPADILTHGQQIKQLKWETERKQMEWVIENQDVARIEEIFKRGAEAAVALGVSRDQLMMGDAVSITREAEVSRMKYLAELIEGLPEGSLDFLPVDTHALINKAMKSVAGVEPFMEDARGVEQPRAVEGRPSRTGDDGHPRMIGLEELDD
ncbi:hypothetical protein HS041_03410 [Planomonospora sp. ID67723]|uniref:hypothetical protein n=1 Tax=Planomonospora sp. ID67723 TaxID=2738134 RepID=UPI0018C3C7C6|nr:hypothetical protein [Planomonospora sp. ID67723]MBG0826822.1 hypothetical protein [Planomonospora sp. ID67723]